MVGGPGAGGAVVGAAGGEGGGVEGVAASRSVAEKARWTPRASGRPRPFTQNQGLPSLPIPTMWGTGSEMTSMPSGASAIS